MNSCSEALCVSSLLIGIFGDTKSALPANGFICVTMVCSGSIHETTFEGFILGSNSRMYIYLVKWYHLVFSHRSFSVVINFRHVTKFLVICFPQFQNDQDQRLLSIGSYLIHNLGEIFFSYQIFFAFIRGGCLSQRWFHVVIGITIHLLKRNKRHPVAHSIIIPF